jgi:hypothetical protein
MNSDANQMTHMFVRAFLNQKICGTQTLQMNIVQKIGRHGARTSAS